MHYPRGSPYNHKGLDKRRQYDDRSRDWSDAL